MKDISVGVVVALCALSALSASTGLGDAVKIDWSESVDLGPGGYARVHRLADGRFMAAYSAGGGVVARFALPENLREWSEPIAVARDFTATNGSETVRVHLANAEFAQLETGRIVYACNLRPKGWRHDIHPCAIAISTSDDAGRTWSPLKVLYRAEVALPADGVPHGCYEPFVLPLKGNAAQIYFADESPYVEAKCEWQNISLIETADGGESWSAPRIVSYTPERRDGMPVVMELGRWRYMAIESNPAKTRLHPQIVRTKIRDNWRTPVLAPSPDRFEPLASPPDWCKHHGSAPYIVATKNYILLSWHETPLPGDPSATSVARVAAVPKREITDGRFTTMRGESTPPGMVFGRDRGLWNSLCPLDGDKFLLVSECRGRIKVFQGEIKQIERDEQ